MAVRWYSERGSHSTAAAGLTISPGEQTHGAYGILRNLIATIGTIVLKAESEDIRSLTLTDDADQLQLVTDEINLYNLAAVAVANVVKEIAARMLRA